MSALERVVWLALLGGLIAGCRAEPVGVRRSAEHLPVGNAAGSVTIETSIDFGTLPFVGTFEVTEGAELLGCDGGTFGAAGPHPGATGLGARAFTCGGGPGVGTFTASFQPTARLGPRGFGGQWKIVGSTGDFVGLRGEGEFTLLFTGPTTAEAPLGGNLSWDS